MGAGLEMLRVDGWWNHDHREAPWTIGMNRWTDGAMDGVPFTLVSLEESSQISINQ